MDFSIERFYSNKNRETTRAIDNFLLKKFSDDEQLKNHIKCREKTSTTKIKSFFIRIGFEIGNSNKYDWKDLLLLYALCELLNLSNYLIERGIDKNNQNDLNIGYKTRGQVLENNLLRKNERIIFRQMINDIDKYLKIDNEILVWDKKINKKNFLKNYKQKCYLVGGQYYGQRFPEDFKYYQKQYNSIRKHKITLPIYFGLFEWKSFDRNLFFDLAKKGGYETITDIFLKEKIIKRCKTFIRKYNKAVD